MSVIKRDDGNLKRLFVEITKGYTEVKNNKEVFYIKHFDIGCQSEIDDFYFDKLDQLEYSGIPTEAEVLESLEKKRIWTKTDENFIKAKELEMGNLIKTRDKQMLPSMIDHFDGLIKDVKNEITKKKNERAGLIGMTRERFANDSLNSFFILRSFYKDKEGKTPLFSEDVFDEMEDSEVLEYTILYNKSMKLYNDNSIKKIAVQSFFQNIFYLAEDVYQFWGKPIKDLTIYQAELSSYGRYFKSIIQNSEHEIPDDIRSDPDRLISFTKANGKMKEEMSKGTGHNHSITGTAEDFKKLGIKTNNVYGEVMRQLGKTTLTKEEMLLIDRGEAHLIKK